MTDDGNWSPGNGSFSASIRSPCVLRGKFLSELLLSPSSESASVGSQVPFDRLNRFRRVLDIA